MKAIPVRKIKKLIEELVDAAEATPSMGFDFTMTGAYELDKDSNLGLVGSTILPEPLKIEVETGISRSTQGAGQWSLRIWKDPYKCGPIEFQPIRMS